MNKPTADETLNSVAREHGHRDWELARYRLGENQLHVLIKEAMEKHARITNLKEEAEECLEALSYWDEKEFKDALNPHHKLKGMRPMILVKKLLNKLI